jgi:transcriptional regulator with XRE-family HTH domain
MLTELGFSTNMLSQLESRNSFPSGDKIAKIALYLDVSVDYLIGMNVPAKEPGQVALEAYLAMTEEGRKAFIQARSDLDPDAESASGNEHSEPNHKRLHAQLEAVKNELIDSISALHSKKNALRETIDALVSAPDPCKSLIVQFLDLPSQQQKLFVLEAIVRMERWQP